MDRFLRKKCCPLTVIFIFTLILPQLSFAQPSGIISDDFSTDTLKTAFWTLTDPFGAGTDSLTGTHLMLSVPSGINYDPWTSGNHALRVMQPSNDTDFQVEAKFESELTQSIQGHGIIVEESTTRFLRFDVFYLNGKILAFSSFIDGSNNFDKLNPTEISINAPMWLRVTRVNDDWTYDISPDGTNWTTLVSFAQSLTVSAVGPFVDNFEANSNPAPAYTGFVDYFFNTDSIVDPEDGTSTDATPPSISNVSWSTTDNSATITWTTDEFATSRVDYGRTASYTGSVESLGLKTNHSLVIEELKPNTAYHYQISSTDGSNNTATTTDDLFQTQPDTEGPIIWVWYGNSQKVGHLGDAQNDFNLVGNVDDASGVASMTYSLNGGPEVDLTVGFRLDGYGDGYRLASNGDFNADIFLNDLNFGNNSVVLTAIDSSGNSSTQTVTINRQSGSYPVQGNSVSINWSTVPNGDPQNVGQAVDGLWEIQGGKLRTTRPGYDRLFEIGDTTWLDYEIEAPLTINAVETIPAIHGNPGVGFLMRWKGHWVGTYRNWPDAQPKWGYQPFGSIGWLYFNNPDRTQPIKQFWHGDFDNTEDYGTFPITIGNTYIMKMRCETQPDGGSGEGVTTYYWKIWPEGSTEPGSWDFQYTQTSQQALRRGGVVLISHYVDVSYGNISVTLLSNAPVITSIADTTAIEDSLYTYDVEATDPDPGDELTYSLTVAPAWLSIDSTSGVISGTPTNDDVGTTQVIVKVEDSNGNIDTQSFNLTVTNVNDPPVITSIADTTATEGVLYEYQVLVDDPDVGDSLTYALTQKPSWLSISSSGLISGTPGNDDVGSSPVTVEVNDGNGGTATQPYTLTVENVNNAPIVTSTPLTLAIEDQLYEYQVEATDPDGDSMMYFLLLPLPPTWLSIDGETGLISGTPTNADTGEVTVRVVVDDDNGGVTPHQYTLRVKNENDPPVLDDNLPQLAFNEDDSLSYLESNWYPFVSDPDDNDTVMVFSVTASQHISVVYKAPNFVFQASPDWFGTETMVLEVSDGQYSDSKTFEVTVNPINDAPEFVNLPDSIEFENTQQYVLPLGAFVEDKESLENELTWEFGVSNNKLEYQFNQASTTLTLSAPNFNGIVSLLIRVTDDSMASSPWGSIVVKVTGTTVGISGIENQIPTKYVLDQNYPNPFNPVTRIRFGLPTSGEVTVEIFNIVGEKVSTLWQGYRPAGYHIVDFDATYLSSGMYLYRIEVNGFVAIKRMILMK